MVIELFLPQICISIYSLLGSPGSLSILAIQNILSALAWPSQYSQYHLSVGSKHYTWISVCFSDDSSTCASGLFCHSRCDTNIWAALFFTFLMVYNPFPIFPSPCVFYRALKTLAAYTWGPSAVPCWNTLSLNWRDTLHQISRSVLNLPLKGTKLWGAETYWWRPLFSDRVNKKLEILVLGQNVIDT